MSSETYRKGRLRAGVKLKLNLLCEVCDSSAGEKVAKLGELIRRLEAGWPGPSSAQQVCSKLSKRQLVALR
eukprot:3104923-Amphidinium_carterae.1